MPLATHQIKPLFEKIARGSEGAPVDFYEVDAGASRVLCALANIEKLPVVHVYRSGDLIDRMKARIISGGGFDIDEDAENVGTMSTTTKGSDSFLRHGSDFLRRVEIVHCEFSGKMAARHTQTPS